MKMEVRSGKRDSFAYERRASKWHPCCSKDLILECRSEGEQVCVRVEDDLRKTRKFIQGLDFKNSLQI